MSFIMLPNHLNYIKILFFFGLDIFFIHPNEILTNQLYSHPGYDIRRRFGILARRHGQGLNQVSGVQITCSVKGRVL